MSGLQNKIKDQMRILHSLFQWFWLHTLINCVTPKETRLDWIQPITVCQSLLFLSTIGRILRIQRSVRYKKACRYIQQDSWCFMVLVGLAIDSLTFRSLLS
jgi:hypothetical protein